MSKVFRIFVEKKKGNDIEAGQTLADLRDNVGLSALEDLRIINRYYAQGLTEEEFNLAVKQILSEPNLDNVYTELSIPEDYRYFAMEYLPGQYDQRADSAAQCIQLLTAGERPEVQSAKIIAVKGDITDEEFEKIKNYIINPVESRVASLEIPESFMPLNRRPLPLTDAFTFTIPLSSTRGLIWVMRPSCLEEASE